MSKATDAARADALEAAGALVEETLDAIADEVQRTSGYSREDVLDYLRVAFGLRHPRGPHHTAPGFASIVEAAKA